MESIATNSSLDLILSHEQMHSIVEKFELTQKEEPIDINENTPPE
jgi:hypothetical protein